MKHDITEKAMSLWRFLSSDFLLATLQVWQILLARGLESTSFIRRSVYCQSPPMDKIGHSALECTDWEIPCDLIFLDAPRLRPTPPTVDPYTAVCVVRLVIDRM